MGVMTEEERNEVVKYYVEVSDCYIYFYKKYVYISDHMAYDATTNDEVKKQTLDYISQSKDLLTTMQTCKPPKNRESIHEKIVQESDKILNVLISWEKILNENTEITKKEELDNETKFNEGMDNISKVLKELNEKIEDK